MLCLCMRLNKIIRSTGWNRFEMTACLGKGATKRNHGNELRQEQCQFAHHN